MSDLFSDDTSERTAIRPAPGAGKDRNAFGAFLAVILGLVVIVGGVWGAAYAFADAKLPRNTSVAGVQVGGMTPTAARQHLQQVLGDRLSTPVTLKVGDSTATLTPHDAGFALDAGATIDQVGVGRSWDPQDLWNHYTGGSAIKPVLTKNPDALEKALAKVNKTVGSPARDGAVTFGENGVSTSAPANGRGVQADAFESALRSVAVEPSTRRTVSVDPDVLVPDIDEADVQAAVTDFANPAVSGPVTLTFGDSPVELSPSQFAPVISLKPVDGHLVPTVDQAGFDALLKSSTVDRNDAPVDATVTLEGGKPVVVPAKPGVSFDPAPAASVFQGLLTQPAGQRIGTIEAKVAEPEISTETATSWQITEKVSTFTTHYPYAEYRNTNIGRAAEIVNGTIVKPGETFSLNDTVGERTRANGFTEGWTIQDGVFKSDLGGGVSQMATTTFNAMFFAGLKDVEHHPHSLYIDRYPVGREATVAWGSKDLRFKNDTQYGVLIRAAIVPSTPSRQGTLTVSMWSTKVWDITTSTGAGYALTPFKKREIDSSNCEDTVGAKGFQINVKRYFHPVGSKDVTRTENFHTTYIPQDEVKCTGEVKHPA